MKIRIGRLVLEAKITPTTPIKLADYLAIEGFYDETNE